MTLLPILGVGFVFFLIVRTLIKFCDWMMVARLLAILLWMLLTVSFVNGLVESWLRG